MVFSLTGCGNTDAALTKYEAAASDFCTAIETKGTELTKIDLTSDTSSQDVLTVLDDMETSFQAFSAVDVPSDYSSVEKLADDANTYMQKSVKAYHQVLEADTYDAAAAAKAYDSYQKAMNRVGYIADILAGVPVELADGDKIVQDSSTN